jgi:hypothetical protein
LGQPRETKPTWGMCFAMTATAEKRADYTGT